ncbi:hypothetical protein DDB_G0287837 [Dictyostelium discoideum AX4]|uniref:Uncharacterized protein DDB_G0287837 n=1 Tax=Dictyostelium discoideum TaxID=44689 RepID=Y7668_DICDI|nr:hypothetical protein DDB_G0287837 [Dictyostelium discoideum AX4]Q54JR4.1 RecName: Full=Uncharacterized protein DDB_G0287837 [Dictyostelium discoideum]EAL63565.1 hypothetical protein DDB_G0287837 [Dictyostelium discoideum AX4]|eukprot:XP_637088.1 hypothetical protein DDB_G0287837 [Dictyostelium discoideum AX4]
MKNNTKIIETKCSMEQINVSPKYYDIISFGYFPNYFNINNSTNSIENQSNNIKEYKISILEDFQENDNQTNKLCTTITNNIKIIKKISKSKKLNSKSHIFKKRNFKSNCTSSNQNSNNVIATLILPKIDDNNNNNNNDQIENNSINCINNNNINNNINENNKFTWVYYHYDCNGKRKSIYDDNEMSELSTTPFPKNHICSKCSSSQRSVFKLNKFGKLDCSFCLNNNNNTTTTTTTTPQPNSDFN